ncbi:MAG: type II toxin-antitoxin system RelE/ParE family toxin [Pseudomonadota bacterium]|nr:type II toxin-antitoxin system RelE/ParE family toxin [Pseudomonadota bacterium]
MTGVIYRPEAVADIVEASAWYARQKDGLGEEFLSAVRDTADRLSAQPLQYAVVHRDTRRALVRRFPYGLFYRLWDQQVVVVACFHTSRNPRNWRSRK